MHAVFAGMAQVYRFQMDPSIASQVNDFSRVKTQSGYSTNTAVASKTAQLYACKRLGGVRGGAVRVREKASEHACMTTDWDASAAF